MHGNFPRLWIYRRHWGNAINNPDFTVVSMEDFAHWLASFLDAHVLDTQTPCRLDLILQEYCWQLSPQSHHFLVKRSQKVVKWCLRRHNSQPSLPLFDMQGVFPRLWICRTRLNQRHECDQVPDDVERIALKLAINLKYVESVQQCCTPYSAVTKKQTKRVHNMSLREAMETKALHSA